MVWHGLGHYDFALPPLDELEGSGPGEDLAHPLLPKLIEGFLRDDGGALVEGADIA